MLCLDNWWSSLGFWCCGLQPSPTLWKIHGLPGNYGPDPIYWGPSSLWGGGADVRPFLGAMVMWSGVGGYYYQSLALDEILPDNPEMYCSLLQGGKNYLSGSPQVTDGPSRLSEGTWDSEGIHVLMHDSTVHGQTGSRYNSRCWISFIESYLAQNWIIWRITCPQWYPSNPYILIEMDILWVLSLK